MGPEKLVFTKVRLSGEVYLLMPCVLCGLSTLIGTQNIPNPVQNSGNYSALCFPMILSPVSGSLVLCHSFKDLPLSLSLHPVLSSLILYSEILADLVLSAL